MLQTKTNNNMKNPQVVGVRFSGEELTTLDELASADGRTRSGLIRKVMTDYLKEVKA